MDVIMDELEKTVEGSIDSFLDCNLNFSDFIALIFEAILVFARQILVYALEAKDEELRSSNTRLNHYTVKNRNRERSIITLFGNITYKRTTYISRDTGKSVCLLDEYIGMPSHVHITPDVCARILQEVAYSSYYKAGLQATITPTEDVTKQTVMNIVHSLHFPPFEPLKEKRCVKRLYIEADEDHCHLQYVNEKGDIVRDPSTGYKNNGKMVKMIYVHEGVKNESPKSKRHTLINVHYFAGIYEGEDGNEELWYRVWEYIKGTYDVDHIENIMLGSDGGIWIQAGIDIIGMIFVLDGFHLSQRLVQITSILEEDTLISEAKKKLRSYIAENKRNEFTAYVNELAAMTTVESRMKRIQDAGAYIVNNWDAAKLRILHPEGIVGCSTEGHVFHFLSRRLSTLPIGWSCVGLDQMSRLREYTFNGGNMYELALYQLLYHDIESQKNVSPTPESDDDIHIGSVTVRELFASENSGNKYGKYFDSIQTTVSDEVRNTSWFKGLIGKSIFD